MDELHLEGTPTDDQKERLENFLTELKHVMGRWGICLLDPELQTMFIDMPSGNLVGMGLVLFSTPGPDGQRISHYLPEDSILDGDWLVDGPEGPIEQRKVQNVFPRHD